MVSLCVGGAPLRRLQRQQRGNPAALRLHAPGLQLDPAAHRLYHADGRSLDVNAAQLCLLALLFSQEGAVVSGEALAQHLAGSVSAAARRRGEGLISSLNQRCASLTAPAPVERLRGKGYRLSLQGAPPPMLRPGAAP